MSSAPKIASGSGEEFLNLEQQTSNLDIFIILVLFYRRLLLILSTAFWISQQRWDKLRTEQKGTFANIYPDFVVELRSSSDKIESLRDGR